MFFKNADNFTNYIMDNWNFDLRTLPVELHMEIMKPFDNFHCFGLGKDIKCYETKEYENLKNDTHKKITNILNKMYSFPIEWNYEIDHDYGYTLGYKTSIIEVSKNT